MNWVTDYILHIIIVCGKGDLNPHDHKSPPPQDGASTNFAISAVLQFCNFNITNIIFFFEKNIIFVNIRIKTDGIRIKQ